MPAVSGLTEAARGSSGQCNGGAGAIFALPWESTVGYWTDSGTWATLKYQWRNYSTYPFALSSWNSQRTRMSTFQYNNSEKKAAYYVFSWYKWLSPAGTPCWNFPPFCNFWTLSLVCLSQHWQTNCFRITAGLHSRRQMLFSNLEIKRFLTLKSKRTAKCCFSDHFVLSIFDTVTDLMSWNEFSVLYLCISSSLCSHRWVQGRILSFVWKVYKEDQGI